MFPEVYNDARASARVNREQSDQDQVTLLKPRPTRLWLVICSNASINVLKAFYRWILFSGYEKEKLN